MLEAMYDFGTLQGLQINQWRNLGLGFVDDTLFFIKVKDQNISICLALTGMFGDALDLTLNITKPSLINVFARDFHALVWPGKRVEKAQTFRYLGYTLDI